MDTNFISSKNDSDTVIGISEILDEKLLVVWQMQTI